MVPKRARPQLAKANLGAPCLNSELQKHIRTQGKNTVLNSKKNLFIDLISNIILQLLFMLVGKGQIRRGITRTFQERTVPFVLYQDKQVRKAESINKIRKLVRTPGRRNKDRNQIKNKLQKIFALYFGLHASKAGMTLRRSIIGSKRQLHFI